MSYTAPAVSTETALQLLTDRRRRSVLTRLIESEDETVSLDELVDHVVPDTPPPPGGEVRRSRSVRLELHHNHLPRLEAAGLIEYDDRTETIRYRPNERVEKLNRFVRTELERK